MANYQRILFFFLGLILAVPTQAITFTTGLADTEWQLVSSPFGCLFRQNIPLYGSGVFFREAGEDLLFYLETDHNQMREGKAALVIEAPDWKANALTSDLGYVRVRDTHYPVVVESIRSDRMMAELLDGMAPTFTRQAIYLSDRIRVRLSPAQFKPYYEQYLACVSGLLPVNFDQIKRTNIYFDNGQDELDASDKRLLNKIATYILTDTRVINIYIDGHTDDRGSRYENRRLSEKRADLIQHYLMSRNIDVGMMILNYHGERYPVASNATAAGRAKNRRVSIRIERIMDDPDDPIAKHPNFDE
ncbi:flagellar protein MotY [Gynuella sp.]|uniref:flagellar protein MotY n=1 Tax=Gynuella sp. TaxID=2969146 RepID=UPI003D0E1FBB